MVLSSLALVTDAVPVRLAPFQAFHKSRDDETSASAATKIEKTRVELRGHADASGHPLVNVERVRAGVHTILQLRIPKSSDNLPYTVLGTKLPCTDRG